jgi:TetR/AcrR family transcriptional regulator, transcriptional repressor for nem operon
MARPKSFDEEAVLDQAIQMFWERGYEGTSLAELETHLGLGRQSLYNTFGDKHALFLKALERYREGPGAAAVAQLVAPGAGLEAIRGFFRSAVETLTGPGPRRGCFLTNTISERAGEDPEALVRCDQARQALERLFRRALTQGQKRGELPKRLDVDSTATLLSIQNYGLNVMAKTGATRPELNAAVEALFAGLK